MKVKSKQELKDQIDYLERELKMVQDDLDAANLELYEMSRDRDAAEARVAELEARLHGERGND